MSNNVDDDDKNNIQNCLQQNNMIFKWFKKEPETTHNNLDNDLVNFHQESYVKEEIMLSDASNLSDDDDKNNIQNCLQQNNMIFKRFKKEPETTHNNLDNDLVNFHQESYVKEEIMLSDASNLSDDDDKNNIQNCLQQNNMIFKRFKKEPETTHNNLDNDLVNFHQESYVKEEIMLSDASNLSDDDDKNNIQNCLQQNNMIFKRFKKEPETTHNNLDNDLVNFHQESYVKEEIMLSDGSNLSEDEASNINNTIIRNNNIKLTCCGNINNKLPCEETIEIKRELENLDATENSTIAEVVVKSEGNENQNPRNKENSSIQKAKYNTQKKQTTMLDFVKKSSVRIEKLSDITNASSEVAVMKRSRGASKINTKNEKATLNNTTILVCESCNATKKSTCNRSKIQCQKCRKQMKYKCLKCDAPLLASKTGVYYHMKSKCSQLVLYHCDHCDYSNGIKESLRHHIQSKHSAESGGRVVRECARCGSRLKGASNLYKHQRYCGLPLFLKCEFCDFATKYRENLKMHLTKKHKGLKAEVIQTIFAEAIEKERKMFKSAINKKTEPATISKRFSIADHAKLYCSKCDVNFKKVTPREERNCRFCGTLTHLQCLKCDRRYVCNKSMIMHVKSKCGPIQYFQCADCDFRVASKIRLAVHIEMKHMAVAPEDYEKCGKCGKGFKHRFNKRMHESRCCMEEQKCEFCSFRCKTKPTFRKHMQNHMLHPESDDDTVNEATIDETTVNVVEMKDDTSISDRANVSCSLKLISEKEKSRVQELIQAYCSKCKTSTQDIQGRMKCRRCLTKLTYHCVECDKKYPAQFKLRYHVVCKHLADQVHQVKKRHQCSRCDKIFAHSVNLKQHREYCGQEAKFHCDHCPFKSKYKQSLAIHLQRRHFKINKTPTDKIYACQKCDRKYQTVKNLAKHEKYGCGEESKLACDHCGFKAQMKNQLILHLKRVHLRVFTEQLLKCKLCGKESSNLYMHSIHVQNCGVK